MKVLFLFAKSFSYTGGIEKFNQCILKALDNSRLNTTIKASAISLYENKSDERYFAGKYFKGYKGNKFLFLIRVFLSSVTKDVIMISHINFSLIAYLIKWVMPSKKVIVVIHGIEVWKPLSGVKKKLLIKADIILSVSAFTRNQLLLYNEYIEKGRIAIFPNTIDPFFKIPIEFNKPNHLLQRYGLSDDQKILVSITRISSEEQYKGYDRVIESLSTLNKSLPDFYYLICGKYDMNEKHRIEKLIQAHGLKNKVLLTGFIEEGELPDHYLLADIFILPSKGEGFGIAYLEAQACGRKVIAGNEDGSREALLNISSNRLVNPEDTMQISDAVLSLLKESVDSIAIQNTVLEKYGFAEFENRLYDILNVLN